MTAGLTIYRGPVGDTSQPVAVFEPDRFWEVVDIPPASPRPFTDWTVTPAPVDASAPHPDQLGLL